MSLSKLKTDIEGRRSSKRLSDLFDAHELKWFRKQTLYLFA